MNPESLLRVEGLIKGFDAPEGRLEVLRGASLTLHEGEFLAILGESGSGKSTLLHVIGTLEPADAGEAFLAGIPLFSLESNEMAKLRNRMLGFVYQAHHLIPELDALENVMLPLWIRGMSEAKARRLAEQMLVRLGLGHRFQHRPARLSGGEAQRVAVARAMVGRPKLLLADEPTGNLDERTADEVFTAMHSLCKEEKAAVIMVTHSMRLASRCDRMLRLEEGRLHPIDKAKF